MRDEVDRLLARCGGVASRARLLTVVSRNQLDDEIRRGHLVRLFRRAYCRPWDVDLIETRERAALTSVGPPATLSHTSALRRWGLLDQPPPVVHLCVPDSRLSRRHVGMVVHRVARFPPAVRVSGLITATVAPAVVASWPLLVGPDQRGPAITAVRTRLITSAALAAELAHHPRLAGRRELSSLIGLLEAGCESELEIWGHVHVFDVPGLRHAVRQKVVRANGKMYRLDHAYEDERLAVEMDGMRFHSSREQRERDMRRDADLATIAWQTLRLSHHRLHHDVLGCRRDTLATLAARRR